jgi:hypothetical protein
VLDLKLQHLERCFEDRLRQHRHVRWSKRPQQLDRLWSQYCAIEHLAHDRHSPRRVFSWLWDLSTPEQASALRQLGAQDALRDIGHQLTLGSIEDVEYAPATTLASQIRDTSVRLMHQTELNAPAAPSSTLQKA